MYGISKDIKFFNSSELAKIFYEFENIISVINELIIKDEQSLNDTLTIFKKQNQKR